MGENNNSAYTASSLLGSEDNEAFNSNRVDLKYASRQMCLLFTMITESPRKIVLAIVESDVNDYGGGG